MALTKDDLVQLIYENLGFLKKESIQTVDDIFQIIKDELAKGNKVNVQGFGKWIVQSKRARKGRNPQTGKEMIIDARKIVTFKSSYILRKKANDN